MYAAARRTSVAAPKPIDKKDDKRDHKERVNETTANGKAVAACPKNQ